MGAIKKRMTNRIGTDTQGMIGGGYCYFWGACEDACVLVTAHAAVEVTTKGPSSLQVGGPGHIPRLYGGSFMSGTCRMAEGLGKSKASLLDMVTGSVAWPCVAPDMIAILG